MEKDPVPRPAPDDAIGDPVEDLPAGAVPSTDKAVNVQGSPTRCPFCRGDVRPEQEAWAVCKRCLARHHTPCWTESGACAACRHPQALFDGATSPARVAPSPRSKSPLLVALGAALLLALLLLSLTLTVESEVRGGASVEPQSPPRAAPRAPARVAERPAPREVEVAPAPPGASAVFAASAGPRARIPFRLRGAPADFDQYQLQIDQDAFPGADGAAASWESGGRSAGTEFLLGVPGTRLRVGHSAFRGAPYRTLTRWATVVLSTDGNEITWPAPAACGSLEGNLGPSEWVRFVHARGPDFDASISVDLSGHFRLDGLPAGTYLVGAVEGNALFEPEQDQVVEVTIAAGRALEATPPLTSKGSVYRYRPGPEAR